MGLDYIRKLAGKPWLKRWNKGLNRLKEPSLLDMAVTQNACAVTATLAPNTSAKVGDVFVVQATDQGLAVTSGLRQVGRVDNPSAEISTSLRAKSGIAEAVVQQVGLFGDTATLTLK